MGKPSRRRGQPRQGRSRRAAPPPANSPAGLPRSLMAPDQLHMVLPITLPFVATTLSALPIGASQLNLNARWSNITSYFMNVHFIDITFVPTQMPAASFAEMALIKRHLPFDPTSEDAGQSAPYSIASIALLPGYQRWNQGNGSLKPRTYKLGFKMRRGTFATDQPFLFDLAYYSSHLITISAFIRVTLSELLFNI